MTDLSRLSWTEVCARLAAPPPSALHPLAAALLDATEALVKDSGYRHQELCDAESVAYRAWSAADFPRYTAAPPPLSASFLEAADDLFEMAGHFTATHSGQALTALEAAIETYGQERPNAARAPVTPTPEPAPPVCGARYEKHVCALRAGHDYDHKNLAGTVGWENRETDEDGVAVAPEPATVEPSIRDSVIATIRWCRAEERGEHHPNGQPCPRTALNVALDRLMGLVGGYGPPDGFGPLPAPEPARPPAVTRTTIYDRFIKARMFELAPVDSDLRALMVVLDEDEARRDADRREKP